MFAYPGTSELSLCAVIDGHRGLRLVNARGDKEAVFMAAGGHLVGGARCAAMLHGARGLTNALGAVADVRRSEVPVLCLVGMASRSSASHLPPHCEPALIESASAFARAAFDCSAMDGFDPTTFCDVVFRAAVALDEAPGGPVLLGLPEDLLLARFVPDDALDGIVLPPCEPPEDGVAVVLDAMRSARTPVVLVEDYLLRSASAEADLAGFATRLDAPVLQIAYRRGPMLFQQLTPKTVPTGAVAFADRWAW